MASKSYLMHYIHTLFQIKLDMIRFFPPTITMVEIKLRRNFYYYYYLYEKLPLYWHEIEYRTKSDGNIRKQEIASIILKENTPTSKTLYQNTN